MKGRIFLIHWNLLEAQAYAQRLQDSGWDVDLEAEDGARASRLILSKPPDAVVIYLTRLPSHGRETAQYLKTTQATTGIPIVFVDGKPEKVRAVKSQVPEAFFTTSAEIESVLGHLARS